MARTSRTAARSGAPLAAALAALALVGCVARPSAPAPGPEGLALPATYHGVLPCAGCEGVEHTLTLRPDGSYWHAARELGRPDAGFDDIGRWTLTTTGEGGRRLELRGALGEPTYWAVDDGAVLRALDPAGRASAATPLHEIRRSDAPLTRFGPVRVRGMLTHLADATLFESCETGVRYAVVGGVGKPTAELEYSRVATAPGAPVLAAFRATLRDKPPGEEGLATWMSVDSWERAVAGAACDGRPAQRPRP